MAKKEELFRVESNILPAGKLIVVFCGLSFCLLISFIDQNSIGIALPTIGVDLNAANTISWAGTSSLIANTCFQVLYGRLSDIFGRKAIFLSAVALLSIGDLLCGFAQTGPQLYGFRAVSGVAAGGIGALTMMIVSDVVTLENRGKYQGILGSCVGLGNVIGPFLAAAFIRAFPSNSGTPWLHHGWRALFWCIAPSAALAGVIVAFILPPSRVTGRKEDKLRAIDFMGVCLSTIAILLILIPISGGGIYFEWDSAMVISMLTIGGIAALAFLVVEWKFAKMPMMPLHLFKIPAVAAILIQNFLFGIVYYSHLYWLPIYYQNILGFDTITSAALLIPFVATQAVFSIISGQYVSRTKRYGEVIWLGYGLWFLGAGLVLLFNRTTPKYTIVMVLFVEGAGVGNIFQPTLVAAQAHSRKADRAVVISVRNFLRSFGGAVGLAVSASVFSNILKAHLKRVDIALPNGAYEIIASNVLSPPTEAFVHGAWSSVQKSEVYDAYMAGMKGVFYLWVPLMGICFLLCFLIKDRGLQRKEEKDDIPVIDQHREGRQEQDIESSNIPSVVREKNDLGRYNEQGQKAIPNGVSVMGKVEHG